MNEMEMCAIATFWKSIGDNMGISYHDLLHYKSGWKDGLEFYDDIRDWAENYEVKYMVPAATNKKTADELGLYNLIPRADAFFKQPANVRIICCLVPLLLYYVPSPFQFAARNVVGVLMGSRLRKAMRFVPPAFQITNYPPSQPGFPPQSC
jgi:hypothetical protein